jgi:glutamyl-tRNA(Gln) amidotransferase subunit D
MEAKEGDRVKLTKKDGKAVEGILMPNKETKSIVIKQKSGYNIGINPDSVKSMEVTEKAQAKKEKKEGKEAKEGKESKVKEKKGLPTIAILHTGGTIASKVDYETGGVIAQFSAADLVAMVPEITEIANIKTELVANMMSEDMMFSDYQKLIRAVKKHAPDVDGIIIGHGTDTLGYSSAALAFAFEKIGIPVILVGSQRSSDRGSSDAAVNLICAAEFIAKSDFAGVAVCMHSSSQDDKCAILPATKTRKMHTSRRDAFKAVNDEPIAFVDYKTRKIFMMKKDYPKKAKGIAVVAKEKFDEDVCLLKTHPNMKPAVFESFTKNFKAIVLEATGLGHAPTNLGDNNLKNYDLLKRFIAKGGIVAITSQCIFGRVHPHVYVNLKRLSDIGCIFCEDMLPETAFIKLAWLLGNYSNDEAKKLLAKNLRGEITERTGYTEEFL